MVIMVKGDGLMVGPMDQWKNGSVVKAWLVALGRGLRAWP